MLSSKRAWSTKHLRSKFVAFETLFARTRFWWKLVWSKHCSIDTFSIEPFCDRWREKKPRITQEVLLFDRTSILTSIEAKPKWNRRLHQIELEMGWNQTNVKIKCEIEIEANQIGIEIWNENGNELTRNELKREIDYGEIESKSTSINRVSFRRKTVCTWRHWCENEK